jgi:hypothetical protein
VRRVWEDYPAQDLTPVDPPSPRVLPGELRTAAVVTRDEYETVKSICAELRRAIHEAPPESLTERGRIEAYERLVRSAERRLWALVTADPHRSHQ